MKYEFLIKTDCSACLGIIPEFIKKIDGVKSVEFDLNNGRVIINYEGGLSRERIIKIIKEKTGYEVQ
ncbi:hypothetical protein COS61_00080 [Candidatus Wolfebacteria bacterium CG03_land_8_20_14_0_80_40_12]|uniref:HMA domain-containing protein n=1 Tax=Candidatus Wolfebacteria bacterium CG03_land_8_20_14_0_80_40_12 TaxID=1975069 RepID=A0A2M7B6H5_9BACT|nr:MAG: hypothetical protein COS61_00080 [Candidatus Wolfebacteria bacterium CG03_land_8_20_14_0_80_40_12]